MSQIAVIVDDHGSIPEMLSKCFEMAFPDRRWIGINTFEEAKKQLLEIKPGLVIVDWRLGGPQNGGDLIELLRGKLPDTKWLVFTAHPKGYALERALNLGINGCVSKGSPYTQIEHAVRMVLDNKGYFCPETQRGMQELLTDKRFTLGEKSVLYYIAEGKEPKEISQITGLSLRTVYNYVTILRQKTGSGSMVALADYAVQNGIAPPRN